TLISVKLALVGIFLFFTSPIATHAVAQVAYRAGLKPVVEDDRTAPGPKAKPKAKSKAKSRTTAKARPKAKAKSGGGKKTGGTR
ncbi:MAG: monovalent cation/H(+) antiporter subunit G, partial [Pseudomonadota bacterium]|nr:monovalent cation/H(+) antiporter subunit G [Pseudomonadota bacterium]